MPQQEKFFEQVVGNRRVEVIKTYDRSYAREVFNAMDDSAQANLWSALEIDLNYQPENIPARDAPGAEDFLWEELVDAAREDVRADPNLYSFFVVTETRAGKAEDLYIAPDWPSAEAFAKSRIAAAQ